MGRHGKDVSFDLVAVIFYLLKYFEKSGRFHKQINKKGYGFTIKLTSTNKEYALKFIEDLETSHMEPIKGCAISHKKFYYNFHVACGNQEQVEKAIEILMTKYCKAKLSLKVFKK